MSVLLIGSQTPTLLHEPPDAVNFELSQIALDFAEACGYVLDAWQRQMVWWTFARRRDFLWAARDVALEVPRQNGKNIWLEVVELASLVLLGDRLITHSAHRADTSHEHFVSLKDRIEQSDELIKAMPRQANSGFITSHGLESIEFANGARLQFKARMTSSGRGPRPQKVIFDEALVLDFDRVGSMAPGIVAQRNPQIIFASSSPKAHSEVLHSLRSRASKPEPDDRLYFAGWNNPPDIDPDDRDAWYRVNPSLGMGRMTEESLLANRRLMKGGDNEFIREHLGVPELPAGEQPGPISLHRWAELEDPESKVVSSRSAAIEVNPELTFTSIAAAGRRADGQIHGEVVRRQAGDAWVIPFAKQKAAELGVTFLIHETGPAGYLIPQLEEAGVPVEAISTTKVAASCSRLISEVTAGTVHHRGGNEIPAALSNATITTSATGVSAWSRVKSSGDISALVALTIAVGGVAEQKPKRIFAY